MTRFLLIITLFSLSPLWGFDKDSSPTFKDVLASVEQAIAKKPEAGEIPFMHFFHHSSNLHKELAAQFKKDHPKLWKAALSSSGNMHNPKVLPLRAKFPETLRKTPTLKKIEARLNQTGYSLGKISFEKFAIDQKEDTITFYSIVYALPFSRIEKTKPK